MNQDPQNSSDDMTSPAQGTGPRRSYRSSDQTRLAILEAASDTFATQGFRGASLRGIAKAAGVDHSTLIHHFTNKESLLQAVLRWRDESVFPPDVNREVTGSELIAGFVDVARTNEASPELTRVFSTMSAEAGDAEHPARTYLQRRHRSHLQIFGEAITQARQTGMVRDNGLSTNEEAARLVATWEGLEIFDRLHPGMINLPRILEITLRQALGISADKSGPDQIVLQLPEDPLSHWID